MNKMLDLIVVVLSLFLVNAGASDDWSYDGVLGPIHWHRLFPKGCAGKKQSPIDIKTQDTIYDPKLMDFALWYDPPRPNSKFTVKNNGHSVTVKTQGEFFVANGGLQSVYSTAQFHFHWGHANHHGSEHLIDGKASPLELHVVNWDSDNYLDIVEAMVKPAGLAVLGVMFEMTAEDNPTFTPIVEALEKIKDPDTDTEVELPATRIRDFLPVDTTRYFRYNGSLTTPGCFESVVWTLFAEKQTISYRQLFKFRSVLQPRRRHHKNAKLHYHTHEDKRRKRRHMRRNADKVLEAVGIEDDIGKQIELKLELEQMKETTTEPPQHHEDEKPEHATVGDLDNFQLKDADNPDLDKDPTPEPTPEPEPKYNHEDNHADKSNDNHDKHHHKHENHHHSNKASEKKAEEYEIIQNILVNNFRPVQKLHGRDVYRSFDDFYTESRSRNANIRVAAMNDKGNNSAVTSLSSLFLTVMSAFTTIFFSKFL